MPVHSSFVDSLEEVAGLAVGKIGEKKVFSDITTDTGAVAEAVRRFIYQVIREVQSEFRWAELTASVVLASPISEAEGTYQYTLPSDFLRPASNRDQDYVIENGYLFTETTENFPLRYIRYSENPAEWSALLVKCVYFRLALEICMPVTENENKYNALLKEYEGVVFPRAKLVGSFDMESPMSRVVRGRYSSTRSGLSGGLRGAFNRVIGVIAPGHHHDADYSAIDHLHDDRYPTLSVYNAHDHDDLYPTLAIFNAHDHDADYSAIDHTHSYFVPNLSYAPKYTTQNIYAAAIPNWANVSSLSVSFTPRFANSKIRIRVVMFGSVSVATVPMLVRVLSGESIIESPTSSGNRIPCHAHISGQSDVSEMGGCSIELMTNATNTNARTIKVQACILSASATGIINASRTDTDSTSYSRTISTLLVEEIFQ